MPGSAYRDLIHQAAQKEMAWLEETAPAWSPVLIISRDLQKNRAPVTLFASEISRGESLVCSHLTRPAARFARYPLAMLTLISCRESSVNANQFGPHVIPGDKQLFAGGPLNQPILIHGFDRTEEQVVEDYTPFSAALKQNCIVYSWPGGRHLLDFIAAVDRAADAGYRLRDVFSMRHLRICDENLVTHSLGARVALTALNRGAVCVKKLVLMGAAVDWNVFESGGEFQHVPAYCESIHVLYSNRDDVLRLAFPLGDMQGDHRALGLDGPRDPLAIPQNVVLHDVSALVDAHSAYLSNPQCSELVRQLLTA